MKNNKCLNSNICKNVQLNKDIYKIYLVSFVINLQFFGAITIPFFIEFADLNYKRIFILESFYIFILFFTEIPTGIFADKFSRKIALSLGLTFLGLGYFTFGYSNSFNFFILAELFCAFGAAFLSGSDKALLYELLKKRSLENEAKHYLARMQSWGTLGIAISLPFGSLLSKSDFLLPYPHSLPMTFVLSGIVSMIVAIVALSIAEENIIIHKKGFIETTYESYPYIYKNKKLFFLSLNLVLINAPIFFIVWLYQPLLVQSNLDVKYFGIISGIFNLLGVIFLRYISKLESIFGLENLLFLSGFLPGVLFILMSFSNETVSCIVLVIMAASIKSIRNPIIGDYINNEIGNENRATILSAISTMQRVTIFILNPFIGYLCDISIKYAFLFLGTFIIIICFFFKKKEKKCLKK
jgi:MFS family permease